MLFSLEWLLRLCPAGADASHVAAELTARGLTVDSVDETPQGVVLDVDVPANRPDCLGHLGVARELAAALGTPLAGRPDPPVASGDAIDGVRVSIEDPALCQRYTATVVRGVRVGPSPDRVVRQLETCGLRSINNVVDASNLVLLELGHPIHFFDMPRLRGEEGAPTTLSVRAARDGERVTTLDGVQRVLDPGIVVIADPRRAIALAGVMGGAETEIHGGTRDVLIEAARFRPQSIRYASRKLGLQTDASYRFERGVDSEGLPGAQALAIGLLAELAGGEAAPGMADAYPVTARGRELRLRVSQLERLLGFRPTTNAVAEALCALRLGPTPEGDSCFLVSAPTWRSDLEREVDVVEEVARHLGYDRIPSGGTALDVVSAPEGHDAGDEDLARDVLAHLGFNEAIGYAMIAEGEDDPFVWSGTAESLPLTNPIAEPLSRLRRSILPALLRAADLNLRRGNRDVRLFEVGRVFLPRAAGEAPVEPLHLGLVWSGAARPPHWGDGDRVVDLYDLMGAAERVLDSLRPGISATRAAAAPSGFHPGRSVSWTDGDGRRLAWGGALHPHQQEGLDQEVLMLEIDVDALRAEPGRASRHVSVPRYPAVSRDLSLVVTADVEYARLLETLRGVAAPAAVRFEAVDRYQGPPLDPGQASLTIRLTLQPTDRTLTDPETEAYRAELIDRLRRNHGIVLRSG